MDENNKYADLPEHLKGTKRPKEEEPAPAHENLSDMMRTLTPEREALFDSVIDFMPSVGAFALMRMRLEDRDLPESDETLCEAFGLDRRLCTEFDLMVAALCVDYRENGVSAEFADLKDAILMDCLCEVLDLIKSGALSSDPAGGRE